MRSIMLVILASSLWRHAAGFSEMVEMVAIVAKPHGVRAQFDDEIMQFRCRHERLDIVPAGPAWPLGIAQDLTPAAGQQALGYGGEIIRHAHRDMFDWLEQHWVGLGETFNYAQAGRGSKSHVGAVDRVEHAIHQGDRDIDDGIAEWPFLHGLLGGFADRRNILPRHCTAHDFIDEQKTLAAAARLNLQLDVGELAMAAGLAFEP